jgi:hypothetical protein
VSGNELNGAPWVAFTEVIDKITRQPLSDVRSHVDSRVSKVTTAVGQLDNDLELLREDLGRLTQVVQALDQFMHRHNDEDHQRWVGLLDLVELRNQQVQRALVEVQREMAGAATAVTGVREAMAAAQARPAAEPVGRRTYLATFAILTVLVLGSIAVNFLH